MTKKIGISGSHFEKKLKKIAVGAFLVNTLESQLRQTDWSVDAGVNDQG